MLSREERLVQRPSPIFLLIVAAMQMKLQIKPTPTDPANYFSEYILDAYMPFKTYPAIEHKSTSSGISAISRVLLVELISGHPDSLSFTSYLSNCMSHFLFEKALHRETQEARLTFAFTRLKLTRLAIYHQTAVGHGLESGLPAVKLVRVTLGLYRHYFHHERPAYTQSYFFLRTVFVNRGGTSNLHVFKTSAMSSECFGNMYCIDHQAPP